MFLEQQGEIGTQGGRPGGNLIVPGDVEAKWGSVQSQQLWKPCG